GREARLVDVDVAQPGDTRLVEQRRLHRPGGAPQQRVEPTLREIVGERLDAQTWQHAGLLEQGRRAVCDAAEAPAVIEAQLAAVVEGSTEVRVLGLRGVAV